MLLCIVGIGVVFYHSETQRRSKCMGIPISTELSWRDDLQYQYVDYSDYIFFNGEKAAIDLQSSTIYIPQELDEIEYYWDIEGQLEIAAANCQCFVAPIQNGQSQIKSLSLYVLDGNGHFSHYNVVFTSLPVLRLDGLFSHQDEETLRNVMSGSITVWSPYDPDLKQSSVKTSLTQWHIRGYSSSGMEKKAWKLSLKEENGENHNESFLGLGKDDDWILNAMSMDDTKMKERLFIELWNKMVKTSSHNLKMSSGEYVEAVINGEYYGLYFLQRRVDPKYLELNSNEILMKGMTTWIPSNIQEGYEILFSPYDEDVTYSLLENALINQMVTEISLDNFMDVSLMLDYAYALDNRGYKNMFYALCQREDAYQLFFIPWDTDMSFGVVWTDGFAYGYDEAMHGTVKRQEYDTMLTKYPDLHDRMCSRWQELRQDILSTENVLSIVTELEETLTSSGAFARDQQRWGSYYGGEDTVDNLKRFVQERLLVLDERYA